MIFNLLLLYNPFYKKDVIELHLEILKKEKRVAFGKIRSKSKDKEHKFLQALQDIYKNVNSTNFLQLFLTDWDNLFVAKVEAVQSYLDQVRAPDYYQKEKHDVEAWFIVTDLRELERNNFIVVRDKHLPKFTTPNYGNHTFRLYGNDYDYPLIINMKEPHNYFERQEKFYPNVFKTQNFRNTKQSLIDVNLGVSAYSLHYESLDNIVYAELEYQANKQDPLYDFGTMLVKYSKVLEQESYLLIKDLIGFLSTIEPAILNVDCSLKHKKVTLEDIWQCKNVFKKDIDFKACQDLLRHRSFYDLKEKLPPFSASFALEQLPNELEKFAKIRNEGVHARAITLQEAQLTRSQILGVAIDQKTIKIPNSLVKNILQVRHEIKPPSPPSSSTQKPSPVPQKPTLASSKPVPTKFKSKNPQTMHIVIRNR
ncbi:HP0729 family protein [Helicobacter felis]|uniref:HP0729 family protein n=1 Tax=Helicobacter felis TaxID=214 RepID=UPI000CF14359|nr:HP0729 family protein [Helicobacter felis]